MASRFVALYHLGLSAITHVGSLYNTAMLSLHALLLSNNLLPWSERDVRQMVNSFPSRHSVTGTTKPSFSLSGCYVL
ncbi:hypothetical protein DFH94DRAFT_705569 [Russula ochroleuca]|uniref:Uncharacterized protein n=1 Tax=Russula ochroleuca TaxID=152965 RepID=A0A9P5N654_9AGAM|nr:hypothetical protein DFH94DRAFT_705569 [Russula ochroleuca]